MREKMVSDLETAMGQLEEKVRNYSEEGMKRNLIYVCMYRITRDETPLLVFGHLPCLGDIIPHFFMGPP